MFRSGYLKCTETEGWGPFSVLYEPDFTICFEESLSISVNLLLIIVGIPLIRYYVTRASMREESPDKHFIVKALLSLLLVITTLFYLIVRVSSIKGGPNEIRIVASGVQLCSWIVMGILSLYTHQSMEFSSSTLLIYWPFSLLLQLVELRSLYNSEAFEFYPTSSWIFVSILVVSVLMFIVEVVPKSTLGYSGLDDGLEASPEDQANLYSFLTFSWMSGLLELGARKHLSAEDLWSLPKVYQVPTVLGSFQQAWSYQENTTLDPSLIKALFYSFGGPFVFAGVLKLIQDTLGFIQPNLLKYLTDFVSEYDTYGPRQPIYYGILYSVAMFITAVVQTMFLHQYFQICMTTGMKLRTALVAAIYQKSLRLSGASSQNSSVGEIVNYMSIDAQRLQDLCSYLHIAWSGVFQIIIALVLLYRQLGVSALAGFALMVVAIPLNVGIGRRLRNLQQRLLKVKDSRIKLMDELLNGMKVIKLYAWEKTFLSKLFEIRNNQEIATLRRYAFLNSAATFTSFSLPLFVSFVTFTVYSLISDEPLTTGTVYVTLSLLNLLAFPLNMLPFVLTSVVEAAVSVKRIQKFLTSEELDPNAVNRTSLPQDPKIPTIEIESGSFSWMSDDVPTLNDLHLKIKRGELFGVVGRVGAGKSSFVSAILGDMNKLDGNVTVRGKVAYVPQQPWIMNATVQENITFGHRFDPEFYEETISACALKPDLEMLASGDQTEIGERGINLSGGQKARISLARAVYARADIYLLDDPLSAVDAHVGKHIFTRVLGNEGILRDKTRVLVTHAIHFLPVLDTIAMFENGRISEIGTFNELKANENSAIHHLITAKASEEDVPSEEPLGQSLGRQSIISHHELLEDALDGETSTHLQRVVSHASMRPASVASVQPSRANADLGSNQDKLMTVEESAQGSVQASVYLKYFKACSLWGIIFYLLLALLTQITSLLGISWVDRWSNVNSKSEVAYNVGIYGLIALVSGFFTFTQYLILYMLCGLRAAKSTHDQMLMAVIRAPMSFFDTTPLGRIMNRFSKDQSSIDETLPRNFGGYIGTLMRVIFVVVVISYSTPPFLALVVVLGIFYFKIQGYYLTSSRELKRLDSVTRSPIFSHFQETLGGVTSIRAYEQQKRFMVGSEERLEANLQAYYPSVSLNRWLAVRLEFLGAIIIFSAALLAVLTLAYGLPIAPKVVGMSLTYALNVTQSLNWVIRQYCDIETNIVAMERIQEYIELPSEAPYEAISCSELPMNSADEAQRVASAPIDWPSKGSVEFKELFYSLPTRLGSDFEGAFY
ncbi:hypothetical protein DSO57_1029157 [Entomophthora muscae]|uniref:Uncharacterized protein n=1 Tax=Entomophthora muscae TaxID=34485 RepID=A0ACC2UM08_9FUNG|nr:hypothetical protein DSO57_1029157 [Entomophthora muscae]